MPNPTPNPTPSEAEAFAALQPETIVVTAEQFDALNALLDAPPIDAPRLRQLLRPTRMQSGVEVPITYSGTY